jgi:DNA-binding Lrp family transcriptional regulator
MDELDSAILAALQADGRRTNRDLAAALSVAPSTMLERVRSLHARGFITGYHAEADLTAIGRSVQAMVTVRLRPQSRAVIHGFRDFVAELPETIQVFITTGPDDVIVHVAVRDTDALQAFVLDALTKRREVAGVRTEVIFDHRRNHAVTPCSAET